MEETASAWAHVRIDASSGTPTVHGLEHHLTEVACLARGFADRFGPVWGFLGGLWHDLGKYRSGFQRYIRSENGVEAHLEGRIRDHDKTHSGAGALWAERHLTERLGPNGMFMSRVFQYLIAGHHAGLDNWSDGLEVRLKKDDTLRELRDALDGRPLDSVLQPGLDGLSPAGIKLDEPGGPPGRFALWVRMLFSALVDADFLDTEAFMDPSARQLRGGTLPMATLKEAFDLDMAAMAREALDTPVNRLRADVLAQCRAKAMRDPGVFTLTVPTGGGKTLSSLAFALDHAVHHRKRRVVYAIPYTSIIEQTADIFRRVFAALGDDVVVEHHSNADADDDPDRETAKSRLACENWDAPLVVTTNVQLFESLFARRTSRCRKLHNLVDSVIVLDEAQLLPVEFLQPVVDVLGLLVRDYGATLVLCTATQPVLTSSTSADPRRGLQRGFQAAQVTEIVDDVPALYAALKRVRVHLPPDLLAPRTWDDLADEVAQHEAVLVVVNRRADARLLHRLLRQRDPRGCWHLSALMCPQHRSDVLAAIKAALRRRREALAAGLPAEPARIVSTNLIEAGVDIDLPVVYRAIAGLDSIAQAAGRCNREGLLDGLGDVHVFVPPTEPPPGLPRHARDTCRMLWHERPDDPFALEQFQRYFRRLYHDADLDQKGICDALRLVVNKTESSLAVRFRDAAEQFRLIDDKDSATVLVRYHGSTGRDIDELLRLLESKGPERWLMRKLQRYGVTLYRYQVAELVRSRDIREVPICPGLYLQSAEWEGFYDPELGANVEGAPGDPVWVA